MPENEPFDQDPEALPVVALPVDRPAERVEGVAKPVEGDAVRRAAPERAAAGAGPDPGKTAETPGEDDAEHASEVADKTDMSAVGDDGQVFGG